MLRLGKGYRMHMELGIREYFCENFMNSTDLFDREFRTGAVSPLDAKIR